MSSNISGCEVGASATDHPFVKDETKKSRNSKTLFFGLLTFIVLGIGTTTYLCLKAGEANPLPPLLPGKLIRISLKINSPPDSAGWSTYGENLEKSLRANSNNQIDRYGPGVDIPYTHAEAADIVVLQDSNTKWLSKASAAIRRKTFIGVFASNHFRNWHKNVALNKRAFDETTILLETQGQTDTCIERGLALNIAVKCVLLPLGVDSEMWKPDEKTKRVTPLVMLKTRNDSPMLPQMLYETVTQKLLNSSDFSYLRAKHGVKAFTRSEYRHHLQRAPYMIAYTPFEMYGNFLWEARATDTPVFIMSLKSTFPYYHESLGMHQQVSNKITPEETTTIQANFKEFLKKVERNEYYPREYVMQFSLSSTGEKIVKMAFDAKK